jgi:hypothetical protein
MTEPTSTVDHEHHPKGPNFLLIVILFAVSIIVVFIAAYIILAKGGKHLVPGKHDPHPTSQLVLPAVKGSVMATAGSHESPFIFPQQKSQTCV